MPCAFFGGHKYISLSCLLGSPDYLKKLLLVARFAEEQIKPHVQQMDQESKMRDDIIKGLFDLGVSLQLKCFVKLIK